MIIEKLKIIKNTPLPEYIKLKDWIIFKYQGSDLKFLFETIYLGLAVEKEAKKLGVFNIGINCKEEFIDWIPSPIKYFDLQEKDLCLPGIYKITQFSHLRTNHAELARSLKIPYPLDVKNPFSNNSKSGKSVIIACNGMKETSLPDRHEEYMYRRFLSRGYNVTVLSVPDYHHDDYWAKGMTIQPGGLQEVIDIINSHDIVVSTDNCYLTLVNSFLDKQVIGIFGPTQPRSLLSCNSMKVLQIVDDMRMSDNRMQKACPCEGPKFCHRKYKIGDFPYCFENISSDLLMSRIENLIK